MIAQRALKYYEIARVSYFNSAAYLVNLFTRSLVVVLRIWIFTQLYSDR